MEREVTLVIRSGWQTSQDSQVMTTLPLHLLLVSGGTRSSPFGLHHPFSERHATPTGSNVLKGKHRTHGCGDVRHSGGHHWLHHGDDQPRPRFHVQSWRRYALLFHAYQHVLSAWADISSQKHHTSRMICVVDISNIQIIYHQTWNISNNIMKFYLHIHRNIVNTLLWFKLCWYFPWSDRLKGHSV